MPSRMTVTINLTPQAASRLLAFHFWENVRQLRKLPPHRRWDVCRGLRDGSLKYNRLDRREVWKLRDEVIEDKEGDCEDLVPAVAAEYFIHGFHARPVAYESSITDLYHVVAEILIPAGMEPPPVFSGMYFKRTVQGVIYPLDPSREGGMGIAA